MNESVWNFVLCCRGVYVLRLFMSFLASWLKSKSQVVGCWLLVVCFWLLVVGCCSEARFFPDFAIH